MGTNTTIITLEQSGFIRLKKVLELVPVKKSTWYAGIKRGIFPAPVSLGGRAMGYRVTEIQALLEKLNAQDLPHEDVFLNKDSGGKGYES